MTSPRVSAVRDCSLASLHRDILDPEKATSFQGYCIPATSSRASSEKPAAGTEYSLQEMSGADPTRMP